MYFRSVRFYKHMILIIITIFITAPLIVSINLGIKNSNLTNQINIITNKDKTDIETIQNIKMNNNTNSSSSETVKQIESTLTYQNQYPDLYADRPIPKFTASQGKSVYLTFDDGPSDQTVKILDILKEKGIKATFFVVYKNDQFSKEVYKRIVNEGHSIGVHTYSHVYTKIYVSVESYLDDFNKIHRQIQDVTGVNCQIFRFPGGSINTYNISDYQEIIAEMLRRGFIYYDWNVASSDDGQNDTKQSIFNNVMAGVKQKEKSIVLMHDSNLKSITVSALPDIIEELRKNGYQFMKIDPTVAPVTFAYKSE